MVPPPSTAVILTSSIEDQGRVAACPGEEVVFTCRASEAAGLTWNSDQFSSEYVFSFVPSDPQNTPRIYGIFTATLTEVIMNPDMVFFPNLTSTLAVTATVELSGTMIECTAEPQQETENQTLLIAGWQISPMADGWFWE